MDGSTHRGTIRRSYGGGKLLYDIEFCLKSNAKNLIFLSVGRNVADALSRLGRKPLFVSVVGQDAAGRELINHNPTMV